MKASPQRLAQLSRMEEAQRQTQRQLDMIDRQIIRRMTTLIPQLGRKPSGYRRGKPPDPRAFLERYRSNLAAITAERQPEIDALSRKLARQDTAIEALRARCAPESRHACDDPERANRTNESRSPAECRPGKRHGTSA
ncbi:hypothetical protein IVA80_19915 [Bradyrhizobium sp. 139]|uniref:hypothetical protein n=1 Tax=Bradyrhizobium sp. 139 TaxID=2782616 RepID=UPI001FF763A2|nr:hypothetical protein [Bradyrhizobium sp. 139]MCK1743076.1 hypothetical protein [Bradyrhizobium sp. 139]